MKVSSSIFDDYSLGFIIAMIICLVGTLILGPLNWFSFFVAIIVYIILILISKFKESVKKVKQ